MCSQIRIGARSTEHYANFHGGFPGCWMTARLSHGSDFRSFPTSSVPERSGTKKRKNAVVRVTVVTLGVKMVQTTVDEVGGKFACNDDK